MMRRFEIADAPVVGRKMMQKYLGSPVRPRERENGNPSDQRALGRARIDRRTECPADLTRDGSANS